MERGAFGWLVGLLVFAIVTIVAVGATGFYGDQAENLTADWLLSFGAPSSEEVVQEFQDRGLEVGAYYSIEQETQENLVPKTYEEGTRFTIPSLGPDSGGRVYAFDSREDLEVVQNYYEQVNEVAIFGHSWLYADGTVLVQINGELPESRAQQYGDVLYGM